MNAASRSRTLPTAIRRRPPPALLVGALALVVAALVIGFLGSKLLGIQAGSSLRVTQELSGVVSLVNGDRTNICMTVDGSAEPVCSGLWLPDGTSFPVVRTPISVWVVTLPTANGVEDVFVLKPTGPPST
jgi:hypothetical protein